MHLWSKLQLRHEGHSQPLLRHLDVQDALHIFYTLLSYTEYIKKTSPITSRRALKLLDQVSLTPQTWTVYPLVIAIQPLWWGVAPQTWPLVIRTTRTASSNCRTPSNCKIDQCLIDTEKKIEGFLGHHGRISIHSNSPYESVTSFIFCLNSSGHSCCSAPSNFFRLTESHHRPKLRRSSFAVLAPIVLQMVKKVIERPKSNSPCLASSFDQSSSSSSSLILISTTIALCKYSTEHQNRPSSPT